MGLGLLHDSVVVEAEAGEEVVVQEHLEAFQGCKLLSQQSMDHRFERHNNGCSSFPSSQLPSKIYIFQPAYHRQSTSTCCSDFHCWQWRQKASASTYWVDPDETYV